MSDWSCLQNALVRTHWDLIVLDKIWSLFGFRSHNIATEMADNEETAAANGGASEKEANKPDSPKPDQEIAPPLISTTKREYWLRSQWLSQQTD